MEDYSRHYLQAETCNRHYTLQGVHIVGTEGEYTLGTRSFMIPVYRRHYVWQSEHTTSIVSGTVHIYDRPSPLQG